VQQDLQVVLDQQVQQAAQDHPDLMVVAVKGEQQEITITVRQVHPEMLGVMVLLVAQEDQEELVVQEDLAEVVDHLLLFQQILVL
jgi:AmiR/NasT family two-component response regulator